MKGLIKPVLLLAVVSICLLGYVLNSQSGIIREFQAALLSVQWMLLACVAIWCGTFIFLTFSRKDWPLIGLLIIAIVAYFIGHATQSADAVILLAGVTLGKGVRFALMADGRWKMEDGKSKPAILHPRSSILIFLAGLTVLLAFGAWWHLDVAHHFYPGTRWTGLWDNPNIYGMLMGAGVVLAIGLLAGERSRPGCGSTRPASNTGNANDGASLAARGARVLPIVLFIAAGMMAVGLFFSCSRGAWLGTAVGLLYLAKAYGKFKWRYVLPGILVVAAVVLFFWNATPDNAPWYLKRMDFGRPSAQHRVAAWKAGFEMMRDHPFGVGWNQAVETYEQHYSPPENGAAAITMNDYLMLGTQLGWPGLLCFVAYVGLCFRKVGRASRLSSERAGASGQLLQIETGETRCPTLACRAGAVALLVAFWFDGGLFTLATASVFWILLELGSPP